MSAQPAWLPSGRSFLPHSFGVAVAIEFVVVLAAVLWVNRAGPIPASEQAPMHISLVTLPPAPHPAPPKPVVTPPKPPQPHPQPRSKPLAKPHIRPQLRHIEAPPKPVADAVATAPPTPTPPPPPPAISSAADASGNPDVLAAFEGQVRDAVQAAVQYPQVAQTMKQEGQAQVAFDYIDGSVSGPMVLQSTGFPSLDKAGIQAVLNAAYPPPPASLTHKHLHLSVWVLFRVAND